MKKNLSKFDFAPIAFVAAMVVLLSTMIVTTAQAYDDSDAVVAYTLNDIESVVTKYYDPVEIIADDEYTKYIITLENGEVFYVKQYFAPEEVFHEAIFDTGYTGEIQDLLDLAVAYEEDEDDDVGEINSLRKQIADLKARLQELVKKQFKDDHKDKDSKDKHDDDKKEVKERKKSRHDWCEMKWNRSLKFGDRGSDVQALQRFLNANLETKISESGEGSPGFETEYFGEKTAKALARFQEKYGSDILEPAGLEQGSGFFGSLSQRWISKACDTDFDAEDFVEKVKEKHKAWCSSGDAEFSEGTRTHGYKASDGSYKKAINKSFICRDGTWEEDS